MIKQIAETLFKEIVETLLIPYILIPQISFEMNSTRSLYPIFVKKKKIFHKVLWNSHVAP